MIRVQKCDEALIPAIRLLAFATWPVVYKNIITAAQIEYMLNMMYSEASLLEQIKEKHHQFIIAYDDDQAIGYASYSPTTVDGMPSAEIYRLHKLYVSVEKQGRGIGKLLLNFIIKDIQPKGATQVQLNVNRNNPSVFFYKKNGFIILQDEELDIGNGYVMDDHIMQRDIPSR